MKTIILPGYSPRNKEWAEEIKSDLGPEIEVAIHEWEHWQKDKVSSLSISREKDKILKNIGDEKVNIIAKSVGIKVLMHLLPNIKYQIKKVIICGIPLNLQSEKPKVLLRKGINLLSPSRVVVLQNEKDPMANYEVIEGFIHSIDRKIEVKKMPRSDHHYPYFDEFKDLLT